MGTSLAEREAWQTALTRLQAGGQTVPRRGPGAGGKGALQQPWEAYAWLTRASGPEFCSAVPPPLEVWSNASGSPGLTTS